MFKVLANEGIEYLCKRALRIHKHLKLFCRAKLRSLQACKLRIHKHLNSFVEPIYSNCKVV